MNKSAIGFLGLKACCRLLACAVVAVIAGGATTTWGIFESYSVSSINVGGTASLTFGISSGGTLTNVTVTDVLPSNQVIASNPAPVNGCGGSLAATAGSSTVTLTVPTLASGCTFKVDITAIASGTLTNTVTGTSDQGTGASGMATLTVNQASGPSITYTPPIFPPYTTTPLYSSPTLTGAASATYSLAAGSMLPAGLNLDGSTGDLTGTIPIPGTYTFTVQAATTSGTATAVVTLTVLEEPCDCYTRSVRSAGGKLRVNTATGKLDTAIVDLKLRGGPLPLVFKRYYSAGLAHSGFSGALGTNWMHNFEVKLKVMGSVAAVALPGGKQVRFVASGNTWVLQEPEQSIYQLAAAASGYQFLDSGTKLIMDFSSAGTVNGIEDRNGNKLTVTQGANGPITVSDGLGRSLAFSYNGTGQLTKVTDQTGRFILFAYTGTNLTSFTDANGGVTNYGYMPSGSLLTSETRPLGNIPATYTYNAQTQVQTGTDSLNNATTFAYDIGSSQTTVTDARGNKEIDTSQNSYVLAKRTDALNNNTVLGHDGNFRLTSFTDALGNQTATTYLAAAGYPASITDAEGHTTRFTYTSQALGLLTFYNLTAVNFADGTSKSYAYDSRGNVVTVTDQVGNVTSTTYNSRGQVLTVTNPAGGITTYAYNNDGTLVTATDSVSNTTTFEWDGLGRPKQAVFADGSTASATYDPLDRVLTLKNENGNLITLGHDANSNLHSIVDALNNSSTAVFDTNDRTGSITDPRGNTTVYGYDPVGNVATVIDAASEKFTYTHDAVNRLTSVLDPSGFGASFTYDANGRLTGVTDALSNVWTFMLDPVGQVTQATTPLGESTTAAYDSLRHITSITDARMQVTHYSYEPRGLLNQITAPLGISVSLAYDKLELISGITDPNGNVWGFQSDSTGRLTSQSDPLAQTISYIYDPRNRVKGVSSPLGSAQLTYDAAGNLTKVQFTDGTAKNYTYDADDRLITGNGLTLGYDADGSIITSNGLVLTRDSVRRLKTITYGTGKTVTYGYNARGFLEQVSDWAGGSMTFAYDNNGRLISATRSNGVTTQYGYDKDSRISSLTETTSGQALASITIQRDAAGNTTSETRNLPQTPSPAPGVNVFAYDSAEQVSGDSYDSLGRLTKDALQSYAWNLASELLSYSGPNGSVSFTYDGFGMRSSETSGGVTQTFVLNYALGLPSIAIVRTGGADQRYYIYAPNGALLYAIDASGNVHHWFHFDERGSTTLLTTDLGQITDTYGITPYGETVTVNGNTPNPFTWLGEGGVMQERSTGLYYMRARYYDSTSARFISRDPKLQIRPLGVGPYQYASNNPMSNVDPMGTQDNPLIRPIRTCEDLRKAEKDAWAILDIVKEGFTNGLTVVTNALGLGQNEAVSARAAQIKREAGPCIGTAMTVTSDIAAAAVWIAALLAGGQAAGVTTLGSTPVSQLPAVIGLTTAGAGGAGTATATTLLAQQAQQATTQTLPRAAQGATEIAEYASTRSPAPEVLREAHGMYDFFAVFNRGISLQGPGGSYFGSEAEYIDQYIAQIFRLPQEWWAFDTDPEQYKLMCTPQYAPPEQARIIFDALRWPH